REKPPSPPAPLPQAGVGRNSCSPLARLRERGRGRGAFRQRGGGTALAAACCCPSDSLASSAMPAIAPITPVASIGSSSIFWFGEAAIAFSASTYLLATK